MTVINCPYHSCINNESGMCTKEEIVLDLFLVDEALDCMDYEPKEIVESLSEV
jgi:hypothetical protein